jgi:hypothetical protein
MRAKPGNFETVGFVVVAMTFFSRLMIVNVRRRGLRSLPAIAKRNPRRLPAEAGTV